MFTLKQENIEKTLKWRKKIILTKLHRMNGVATKWNRIEWKAKNRSRN